MCILLPHHLPEIIDSGIQTTLAGDVGLRALIRTDQIVLWKGKDQGYGRNWQSLSHLGHTAIFQKSHLYIVGIDIVRSRDIWVPSLEDDSRVIN